MTRIPSEYLARMSACPNEIEGVEVKVKMVNSDCPILLETYINEMKSGLKN